MVMGKASTGLGGGMDTATFRAWRRKKQERKRGQGASSSPSSSSLSPAPIGMSSGGSGGGVDAGLSGPLSDDEWCEVDWTAGASSELPLDGDGGGSSGASQPLPAAAVAGAGVASSEAGAAAPPTSKQQAMTTTMLDEAQADCKLHWVLLMRAYYLWQTQLPTRASRAGSADMQAHQGQRPGGKGGSASASAQKQKLRSVQQILRRVVAMMMRVLSQKAPPARTVAEFQLRCLADPDVTRSSADAAGYLQLLLASSSLV